MAFMIILLFAFIAIAKAGVVSVAPVYHPTVAAHQHPHPILNAHNEDHYTPHSQYKFAYEVNDEHTGDSHSHREEREGDVVHGEYSLMDADGFKRIVQYNVDSHSGFNAVVNRIPSDQHAKAFNVPAAAPIYSYGYAPTNTVDKHHPLPEAYHQLL